jgi:hypothetical protein
MLTKLKIPKKLCELKNFLSHKCCFFPRPISKKKKWTNICPFFKKTWNTFENRHLFDVSHISWMADLCDHTFIIWLFFVTKYRVRKQNKLKNRINCALDSRPFVTIVYYYYIFCYEVSCTKRNNSIFLVKKIELFFLVNRECTKL